MKLNQHDIGVLTAAAAEMHDLANDIRESSSLGGRGVQWDGASDRLTFERLKGLAEKLQRVRDKAEQ